MAFKFAYEDHKNGFLGWALIMLLGKARKDGYDDIFDIISDRSDKFKNVELEIKVNGFEMDPQGFMDRLKEIMEDEAKRVAKEKLGEIDEIMEIEDELANLRTILTERIDQLAGKYGIELYRED